MGLIKFFVGVPAPDFLETSAEDLETGDRLSQLGILALAVPGPGQSGSDIF